MRKTALSSRRISGQQHHSLSQPRDRGRFAKARTNGAKKTDAASTMTLPMSYGLQRILRPQAAFRWILPNLAAITPQYIEMILRGALAGNHVQQWELFDLMFDTWPELNSCAQELTYGVLRKKLIYEPYHEEDEKPTDDAIERMKLVAGALRAMEPDPARDDNGFHGTLKDILDGWFRGVTVLETIWQVSDDKLLGSIMAPKSTFWVHPVCFAFNADGVLGLRDTKPMTNSQWPYPSSTLTAQPQPSQLIPFPDHKFLIAIHKAKSGTALGGPLLRPLAWWWCAANFSADWLLNLAQVFGLPFRWANYDPNAPQGTVDAICNMLQNMGNAGWAAFPTGTTLELKDTAAGRQAEYTPQGTLLDRADRYARSLILGQTMSGASMRTGRGGQAFGEVEGDVKGDRVDAAGAFACGAINSQLVRSILMLNYGDCDEPPKVRLLEEEEGGLQDAQRDQVLAKSGLPIGVDFLRKKYGIPEPADGEETIGGSLSPPELSTSQFPPSADLGGPQAEAPNPDNEPDGNEPAKASNEPGHPFYGNQWTQTGSGQGAALGMGNRQEHLVTEKGRYQIHALAGQHRGKYAVNLVKPDGSSVHVGIFKNITEAKQGAGAHYAKSDFPSLLQSEEDKRRAALSMHLKRISAIQDDEVFASELNQLADSIS